jgi:hypothetical protein
MDKGWKTVFFKETVFCKKELLQFWVRSFGEAIGFFDFLDIVLGMSDWEKDGKVILGLDKF